MTSTHVSTPTFCHKDPLAASANVDGYMASLPPPDGGFWFMLGGDKRYGGKRKGKPWQYWRVSRALWHVPFQWRERRAEKDGVCVTQGLINVATERKLNSVLANFYFIFDVDNKPEHGRQSFAEALARIQSLGFKAVLYTSHSHGTEGNDKFRVVIAVEVPFVASDIARETGLEASRVWQCLYHIVGKALGLKFDPAPDSINELFFLASCPLNATNARTEVIDEGAVFFDWRPYLVEAVAAAKAELARKPVTSSARRSIRKSDLDELREALEVIPADCGYTPWRDIIWAGKHGFGATQYADEAFALLDEWSSNGDTYNPALLRSIWDSGKTDGPVKTMGTFWHIAGQHGYVRRHRDHDADIEYIDDDEDMLPLFGDYIDDAFFELVPELLAPDLSSREFAKRFYEAFPLSFRVCQFLGSAEHAADPKDDRPFRLALGDRQTVASLAYLLDTGVFTRREILNPNNFDRETLGYDMARMEYA